ncbi:protein tyrosine phosphatase domain-containing protein 1 isoform X1 [Alosa sapidissima]|uniref:protein tyrosine phosphatase domain-containing protein 1 isoform X1 n=1 Tax=Alosa sapidissima TaxID=34773 RepID=UPI001C08F9D4|nr:protein tyrosine phosphatase domain-containing protein 1 isoform X1 [Alosa sapidissima]
MQRQQRPACRSLTGDILFGLGNSRRHSASDVLLKVLQRRRSSALESLSTSSHRVMLAVSMVEADTSAQGRRFSVRVPTAKYTKVGETLRHVIPGHMQCSMTCGGRACKYENPSRWSDEEQAIKGLYSSWITDNLLAMARPSTEIIEKYNIIEQFQGCGLKTVINLQRPGEHASCGNPLEAESGFTYRPEIFMEAGIYFYNFGWKDYGVASLTTILDMVKVMSFAIQEGKMAIHCHAGLGRTGVLLACYLVFTSRMSADQAILFVRAKRPNSIQTRGQLLCVREFAQFLVPLRSVFSCAEPRAHTVTLTQYLTRQRHLLHGYEARLMKHVPKPVQLICRLLLDVAENRTVPVDELRPAPELPDLAAEVEKTVSQQALQQLGKEMRGKGIPVPSPRVSLTTPVPVLLAHDRPLCSEQDMVWRQREPCNLLKPLRTLKRSLSLSDTALHILSSQMHPAGASASALSHRPMSDLFNPCFAFHNSLGDCESTWRPPGQPHCRGRSHDSDSPSNRSPSNSPISDKPQRKEAEKKPGGSCQSRRVPLRQSQRSMSVGYTESSRGTNESMLSAWDDEGCGKGCVDRGKSSAVSDLSSTEACDVNSEKPNFPFIALQNELSPQARRVLVAQALATESDQEELRDKVLEWQTELNSREGTWDRLCLERDPLVLSSLVWSWLEQLRDPVISHEDVEALEENNYSSQQALDSLEKGHKQTLLCILDCAAHLLEIPEEVEKGILDRIIKTFTKVDMESENGQAVCCTLRAVLTPVLHELRAKAEEEVDFIGQYAEYP